MNAASLTTARYWFKRLQRADTPEVNAAWNDVTLLLWDWHLYSDAFKARILREAKRAYSEWYQARMATKHESEVR